MEGIHRLVGNRLALAGAVLYFLEWVAIAFIPEVGDGSLLGDDPAAVVEAYRGHAGAIAFARTWPPKLSSSPSTGERP